MVPRRARPHLRLPTSRLAADSGLAGPVIRRGLGFDECHVGYLLNGDEDHIGANGVEDKEVPAPLESSVSEAVKDGGVSIPNADDPTVVGLEDGFPSDRAGVLVEPMCAVDRGFTMVRPADLIVARVDGV